MITLSSFIKAIQQAVIHANDALQQKNDKALIDNYFTKIGKSETPGTTGTTGTTGMPGTSGATGATSTSGTPATGKDVVTFEEQKYIANTVTLEYSVPVIDNAGRILAQKSEIKVPLITLVPLQLPQIEKVVLTSEFSIETVNGEIEINFARPQTSVFKRQKSNQCKLEITLKAKETPDGLRILVDGYEAYLKRQLG